MRILESESNRHDINAFFLKIGIELEYDNSVYYDCYFIPTTIDDLAKSLRINEVKEYIEELQRKEKVISATVILLNDDLSFILTCLLYTSPSPRDRG